MMKKLTFPFRLGIQELKKDNAFRKTVQSKTIKITLLGFMGQSSMFLFVMLIMYISVLYVIAATFIDVKSVIGLPIVLFMLWFFITLFKNVFPKPKVNFLKQKKVYEKYKEVTKDIV